MHFKNCTDTKILKVIVIKFIYCRSQTFNKDSRVETLVISTNLDNGHSEEQCNADAERLQSDFTSLTWPDDLIANLYLC